MFIPSITEPLACYINHSSIIQGGPIAGGPSDRRGRQSMLLLSHGPIREVVARFSGTHQGPPSNGTLQNIRNDQITMQCTGLPASLGPFRLSKLGVAPILAPPPFRSEWPLSKVRVIEISTRDRRATSKNQSVSIRKPIKLKVLSVFNT